jgi:CheY-like chemotaxis protein
MNHCEILIIDDDKDDIDILTEALNESGVKSIYSVTSVLEAYKYLEDVYPACVPKLIITDLFLPVINGEEFLKQMKLNEAYKDVHMVMISNTCPANEVQRYMELGALYFVVKPGSYNDYLDIAAKIKASINDPHRNSF